MTQHRVHGNSSIQVSCSRRNRSLDAVSEKDFRNVCALMNQTIGAAFERHRSRLPDDRTMKRVAQHVMRTLTVGVVFL